jgi:vacuolar protein sorting-associated protein 52
VQEELLLEHFSDLIKFVKIHPGNLRSVKMWPFAFVLSNDNSPLCKLHQRKTASSSEKTSIGDVELLVKDFASRWKPALVMHKDVITSFSNFLCGMEILKAALTQLLLYYTRLTECVKKINGGSSLSKDLVSISSILYEIKKYSRTF